MANTPETQITMYSTAWCPDCLRAKMVLKKLRVPFKEIDVDKNPEGHQIVIAHNNGQRIVPTIFFPDGSALVEPSNQALTNKVAELGLLPESK